MSKVPVVLIVPGTSKIAALRFPHTVRVDPDSRNGLKCATVFLGFQIQAADPSWIDRQVAGVLSENDMEGIEDAVLEALGFDPPDAGSNVQESAESLGSVSETDAGQKS